MHRWWSKVTPNWAHLALRVQLDAHEVAQLGDEVGVKLEQRLTGHAEAVVEIAQGYDPKEPLDDVCKCLTSAVIIHDRGCQTECVTNHNEECFLLFDRSRKGYRCQFA